jgi:hypothetical protein
VAELDQLDPPSAGKAGIQAALDKVQANLAALRGSATGQWGSQITELDGAVEALKTTIAGISGDSLVSDLPTILSDLQRIDTAGRRCSSRSTRTAASPTRRSRSCLGVDRQAERCASRDGFLSPSVFLADLWSAPLFGANLSLT